MGKPTPDDIMSPAELKPLLVRSKHEPVSCVIGLTREKEGVILLDKKLKPKKLREELKKRAGKIKLDLDITILRFGKAVVDTDDDATAVKFIVNKDAPGALRQKLLERVRKAGFGKVDIQVDDHLEAESEDDTDGAATGAEAPAPHADGAPPSPAFAGNPFLAPDAQIEIEKLALAEFRSLAAEQALAAQGEFNAAIVNVEKAKGLEVAAEEAKNQLMLSVAITIALMPAGPIVEAVANSVSGLPVQTKLMAIIGKNTAALEAKFGARGAQAADIAWNLVAGETANAMVKKLTPDKAKAAIEFGVSSLQGQAVHFLASSDKGKCIANYLASVQIAANAAMHNLLKYIHDTKHFSEALVYYNYFSEPLQTIYEAVLSQQVDDMLSEVAAVLARDAKVKSGEFIVDGDGSEADGIVKVHAYGRTLFAHIKVITNNKTFLTTYRFEKWVTPDMEPMVVKMEPKDFDPAQFINHMPDPQREPGERIVLVDGWGGDRVMLIGVEDQGIFWKNYGVLTFKRWAEDSRDDKVLRSRGAMQIGGLERVDLKDIKDVKAPSTTIQDLMAPVS